MASVHRVLESVDGEDSGPLSVWRSRLETALQKAEKLASLYQEARKGGNPQWARNYYKHARREARDASRIIGVLEIEFGAAMAQEVDRAKKVFAAIFVPAAVSPQ